MKKTFLISALLSGILLGYNNIYAYTDCSSYSENMSSIQMQIDDLTSQRDLILVNVKKDYPGMPSSLQYAQAARLSSTLTDQIRQLQYSYTESSNNYKTCDYTNNLEVTEIFNKGNSSFKNQNYLDAIGYYEQALKFIPNDSSIKTNLQLAYFQQGQAYFNKKDYNNAINYYNYAIQYGINPMSSLWNIGLSYYNLGDYTNALSYFEKAYNKATDKSDIDSLNTLIQDTKNNINNKELKNNAPANDTYSYLQYYLKELNIPNAWTKVTNSNQVIVAVIDDGININHPDLANSIWSSPNAKYGSSKIIDFVGDGLADNAVAGEHGTNIAGIIGATQNNNKGIAGISKNVKLMPLRVFNTEGGATEDSIIKAMNYAIDNGANIINLSLGQSQFAYSNKSDSVIKRAYDKGIIVVIAAGNGDVYSKQTTGVNLDNNPISPICNNGGNKKYSIGVYAGDKNGRTSWTNYGTCAPFMAPGEGIITTSLTNYTNENPIAGTSFSAPIISGIITLGYNQFGYVSPDVVYDSLRESLVKNSNGINMVDASKYLDILGTKINQIKIDQSKHSETVLNLNVLNSNSSNGDILANFGIVTKRNNQDDYRINDFVLRQEVVGMAIKVMGKILEDGYVCRNIFKDVSSAKPNNWACRSIETASDFGVVSKENKTFRPEDKITRAEALAIIMRAANISGNNTISSFADVNVDWQVKLTNKALDSGIIDKENNFRPNQNATRGEIFEITKRILKTK